MIHFLPVEDLLDSLTELPGPILFFLFERLLDDAPADRDVPDEVVDVEGIVQELFVVLLTSEGIVETGDVTTCTKQEQYVQYELTNKFHKL